MKNANIATTALALLVATNLASAGQQDEIIVAIPSPDSPERSPGTMCAELSREDVEYAKGKAREAYQAAKAEGVEKPIVVQLPDGVFQLAEPIVFGPEDNGDAQRPIVWRGSGTEPGTWFSGGEVLSDWTEIKPGVVQTKLPDVAAGNRWFRTIWNAGDGKSLVRCRMPKDGYFRIEKTGEDRRTNFTWQGDDLKSYEDLSNVELVFIHDWSITRCPIQSLDTGTKTLRVPRQIGSGLHFFKIDHWEAQPRYFVENSIQFLSKPGEWHLDRATGKLTYCLQEGETAESLVLIAPKLENTLIVAGTADSPVQHLGVEKVGFSHTGARPEAENTYWGIQATWHHQPKPDGGVVSVAPLSGAVDVVYAENCRFNNITVRNVAGTGLTLGRGTAACTLQNSRIAKCGGNGVMVGAADQDDPARGNTITDCRIVEAGQVFFGAVGIWIGFAQETTVCDSTIRQMPYTGISCGWLWSPKPTVARAQKILNNHIGHCMQVLSDGGGIYTLCFQPDSRLAGNYIHHIPLNACRAESNVMFLDEGTKGFTIENNFIHGTDKSPLRFHRADTNLVKQNYLIVPNDEVPMIRYNNTPEVNITKIDNVTKLDNLESAVRNWREESGLGVVVRGIPGYRARIRPIVSRITIHWPSFYNVVTGKTLALPNLIALQHIPLSPAGVIAKRPAPIALPNSCAAEWRMAPDAVFSPYASVRYFTPHMVHSQYNLL